MFYKWRVTDFVTVPAHRLRKGDEIAYAYGSKNNKYGAIPIEDITRVEDWGIALHYCLPVGAIASSKDTVSISIYWRGKTPLIDIWQDVQSNDSILIRRK